MKDVLLVYYSRTGNTRRLAQQLAGLLDADLEEIRERHGRHGMLGFARSLYDALRAHQPRIEAPRHDARLYKMVIVGSPVWAGHVAAPVRSYLTLYGSRLRQLAFFCVRRGSGAVETLAEMAALRQPDIETIEQGHFPGLSLTEAQLRDGAQAELSAFVDTVRQRMRATTARRPRGKAAAAAAA